MPKTAMFRFSANTVESTADATPESVLARRYKTQRVHHAQLVGYAPVLDHLSVLEPRDVDHVDERRFSRRGPAREATDVRAAATLARPDLVAYRDQLVDRDVEVGERAPQVLDGVLGALSPIAAAAALVLDRPRRDQLVGNRQVALVEALLDQTPVDSLVGRG